MGQRVFAVLESRQPEGPSPRPLLPVLSKVVGLAPGTLQEGTQGPSRGTCTGSSLLAPFPSVPVGWVWEEVGVFPGERHGLPGSCPVGPRFLSQFHSVTGDLGVRGV